MAVKKVTRKMHRFGSLTYLCIGVSIIAVLFYHSRRVITKNNSTGGHQMEFETKPSNKIENNNENHTESIHYWAHPHDYHEMKTTSTLDSAAAQRKTDINSEIRPPCDLSTEWYVMDVLERMTTVKCKWEAAILACLHRDGKLYPERLPRNCQIQEPARGEYLGCYLDNSESRVLGDHFSELSDNKPEECMDHCLRIGYTLSGVQYGKECFCGDNSPNQELILPETACNMTCSGDDKHICGGNFAINIFRTGISKLIKREFVEISSNLIDQNRPRVKILYVLTLNGRSVRQVRRLFRALYHSTDTYFIIHVDSRQDYMFNELLPLEERFPNVRLSRYRLSSVWGGSSLLAVILHCMEEALSLANWHWDYLFNLSESDFPIKTHEKLITFLTANNGLNFLGYQVENIHGLLQQQGLFQTFYECENRMWNIGDRKLPSGIEFGLSSDWFGLTRSFVQYAVQSTDELVVGLKHVYKYTLMSTESFFQTLLVNSEFRGTSTHDNLRHISWKNERCGCMHRRDVDWCGCSPSAFTVEDWPKMRETNTYNVFMARKFSPLINQAIVNHVDTWVYGVQPDLPGWTSYWENEFHSGSAASPPVKSAFYTVYASLSRLSVKKLNSLTLDQCNLTTIRIREGTLYKNNDIFKGTLVLFDVVGDVGSGNVVLESKAMPKDFYQVISLSEPVRRLKSIEVGSHYSNVDYAFRNLGRIFDAHSILGVMHKWIVGEPLNASVVWIDSTDSTVAGFMDVEIPGGSYTGFQELSVSQPLRPGIWTVKLLHDWKTVAETKFLVVPLSHNGMSPISAQEAEIVNGGLAYIIRYSDANFSNVEQMLGFEDRNNAELRLTKARQNGKLFGSGLLDWIDELVAKFYNIKDMCYVKTSLSPRSQSCIRNAVNPCRLVSWSSRSIDSKSVLGRVNKLTGLLER